MSSESKSLKSASLNIERHEMGRADTLRYNINAYVIDEKYDSAIEELESYYTRDFDLPGYKEKIKPYINHATDLVNAIRAKKGFSKNISLTRSKTQELQDTIRVHYDELQYSLRKIESIKNQIQVEDMRSTVWIIKAIVYSIASIVLLIFIKELIGGVANSANIVFTDYIDRIVNFIFEFFDL